MATLNEQIREYTRQLQDGQIQKAYKGLLTFMSELKTYIEVNHPEYAGGGLYSGYMDMTYFAITPAALKNLKLKIAVVYLHEESKFETWLAANNRPIQADWHVKLSQKSIAPYTLEKLQPGVDAIIAATLTAQPDFDQPEQLKQEIATKVYEFTQDMLALLNS